MIKAEQAGVPVGTYVYSTALSAETALKEAQYAIEKMQGYKVSYPVVFDLEYAKASNLSPKKVSQMALAFCNEVRKAGYYPMVYCNTNWYDNYIDWSLYRELMYGSQDMEIQSRHRTKTDIIILSGNVRMEILKAD